MLSLFHVEWYEHNRLVVQGFSYCRLWVVDVSSCSSFVSRPQQSLVLSFLQGGVCVVRLVVWGVW